MPAPLDPMAAYRRSMTKLCDELFNAAAEKRPLRPLAEVMRETRHVTCEGCGGEGRDLRGHPNDPHPRDVGPCQWCNGTGVDEVKVEPITEAEAAEPICTSCGNFLRDDEIEAGTCDDCDYESAMESIADERGDR